MTPLPIFSQSPSTLQPTSARNVVPLPERALIAAHRGEDTSKRAKKIYTSSGKCARVDLSDNEGGGRNDREGARFHNCSFSCAGFCTRDKRDWDCCSFLREIHPRTRIRTLHAHAADNKEMIHGRASSLAVDKKIKKGRDCCAVKRKGRSVIRLQKGRVWSALSKGKRAYT